MSSGSRSRRWRRQGVVARGRRAWLRRWWRMALEWNIAEQDRGAHGQVKGSRGACATRGAGAGAGAGIYHVIRGGRETEVAFVRRCRRWHEGATATGATCGRATACTAVVLSPVASAWVVSESLASGDSSSSFLPPAVALTPHEPPAGWIKSVSSLGCRQLLLCRSQASVDLLLDRINTRLTVTQGLGDSCRGPRSSFMHGLCPQKPETHGAATRRVFWALLTEKFKTLLDQHRSR